MRLMSNSNDDRKIDQIIQLMQSDASYDAPQDAIRWSKNIFLSRARTPQKSLVERVFAVLQMDLPPNRAAFGERSASASQARQMLFQADETKIDLRIKEIENGLSIQGQISGVDFANSLVRISNESNSFETQANGLSEFRFDEISVGETCSLHLRSGEKEIVIENLEIR